MLFLGAAVPRAHGLSRASCYVARAVDSQAPKVFICDPHPFMLQGVEGAFKQAGLKIVGARRDPSALLTHADEDGPVIHFVDHTPGGPFGARLIRGLIDADPTRRVIANSSYTHLSMIAGAYEAGAAAFLNKQAPSSEALDLVHAVHALVPPRCRVFPGDLAGDLAEYYIEGGAGNASPRRLLTARQLTVFLMIAEGMSVVEVAHRLQVNRRTVGNHMVAIRRRLNIPREHYRSVALEHRLIDPYRPFGEGGEPAPAP